MRDNCRLNASAMIKSILGFAIFDAIAINWRWDDGATSELRASYRCESACGRNSRHGAARLPQGVSKHCEGY